MNRAVRLSWVFFAGVLACATTAQADTGTALRAKFESLKPALANNPFGRPLVLDSVEATGRLQGDIHAVLNYPIGAVSAALRQPAQWCAVLSLHSNTKHCRTSVTAAGQRLLVHVGTKSQQDLARSSPLDFGFRVTAQTPDTLEVSLQAMSGPLGTSDYRIALEVVALPGDRTFLHLAYSYGYGMPGRMALQTYLATAGSGKVGFSREAGSARAVPQLVGGLRGLVERNTMRYYLAIDALLDSLQASPEARFERRLQRWFTATEQYPQQLHEMDWPTYRQMKVAEQARQQDAL
ncbi:MAG: hypothetical protein LH632_00765 [Rhodoferax sp.]|nr:hypothetical protein [Rhodoferax sp.]